MPPARTYLVPPSRWNGPPDTQPPPPARPRRGPPAPPRCWLRSRALEEELRGRGGRPEGSRAHSAEFGYGGQELERAAFRRDGLWRRRLPCRAVLGGFGAFQT